MIDCRYEPGLIHKITGVVLQHELNIVRNQESPASETRRFFMRTEVEGTLAGPEYFND